MKVKVFVEKGKDLYACTMEELGNVTFTIIGDGTSARKAIADFLVAHDEMKQYYEEEGKPFPKLEFEYIFDVGSLFNYYSFLNITETAKSIGISPMMMRKYAAGISTPSDKRLREIEKGMKCLSESISDIKMWTYRETSADRRAEAKLKDTYNGNLIQMMN